MTRAVGIAGTLLRMEGDPSQCVTASSTANVISPLNYIHLSPCPDQTTSPELIRNQLWQYNSTSATLCLSYASLCAAVASALPAGSGGVAPVVLVNISSSGVNAWAYEWIVQGGGSNGSEVVLWEKPSSCLQPALGGYADVNTFQLAKCTGAAIIFQGSDLIKTFVLLLFLPFSF